LPPDLLFLEIISGLISGEGKSVDRFRDLMASTMDIAGIEGPTYK
jgi:hypothetical protein